LDDSMIDEENHSADAFAGRYRSLSAPPSSTPSELRDRLDRLDRQRREAHTVEDRRRTQLQNIAAAAAAAAFQAQKTGQAAPPIVGSGDVAGLQDLFVQANVAPRVQQPAQADPQMDIPSYF